MRLTAGKVSKLQYTVGCPLVKRKTEGASTFTASFSQGLEQITTIHEENGHTKSFLKTLCRILFLEVSSF